MGRDTLYVTTTLPYVNADPHIGFALELCQADAVVRDALRAGTRVFFNTGTDEHGLKIFERAVEQGRDPQGYVDEYAAKYKELIRSLGLWEGINFVRTTDPHHKAAAQEFWKRCNARGDIYKKNYTANYCVGCELEKTDSELDAGGRCPLHPNRELEVIEEENYFFRFSRYEKPLLKLYAERPDFVVPDWRQDEIEAFVAAGLRDFSISRLREKMPWGVPVPGDGAHVMYVWFDALVNYVSAIGWPGDMETFARWWPVVQFAGKDQVRQQAAIWQAMLMSAGLEPSKQILVHGFITSGGQKMSKSLGNVINPLDIVVKYGADALRAFLLKEVSMFDDGDVTMERFDAFYHADLANGIGNLVSRVMTMAEAHSKPVPLETPSLTTLTMGYDIPRATAKIWNRIAALDGDIQRTEPYKLVKTDPEAARTLIERSVRELGAIALMLEPIMPETARKILGAVRENKAPTEPLFPRKR